MALSTFSRQCATGIMDLEDPLAKHEVRFWIKHILKVYLSAKSFMFPIVSLCSFTEVFMEEYGGFYYAALETNLMF